MDGKTDSPPLPLASHRGSTGRRAIQCPPGKPLKSHLRKDWEVWATPWFLSRNGKDCRRANQVWREEMTALQPGPLCFRRPEVVGKCCPHTAVSPMQPFNLPHGIEMMSPRHLLTTDTDSEWTEPACANLGRRKKAWRITFHLELLCHLCFISYLLHTWFDSGSLGLFLMAFIFVMEVGTKLTSFGLGFFFICFITNAYPYYWIFFLNRTFVKSWYILPSYVKWC